MKKSAKNVGSLLVLVGFVAALGGCAGWSEEFKKGYELGGGGYEKNLESTRQTLYTEHEAKKRRESTKDNIRIAVVQTGAATKEFSVQVLRAEGMDLPELTPEKIEVVKTSIVKILTKKGFQVTDTASLSLVISLNQYKEGDPALVRASGSAFTLGAKKYDPAVMGGTLLLTKGETEVILDMDIPTETTGTNVWTLDMSTGWTLDAVREIFSLMIVNILNDYWNGKLTETSS